MLDGRVEIITGRERRRRWQLEDKLRIVAEAEAPGARFAHVAALNEVPVRVRRLLACACGDKGEARSFAVLDLGNDAVAPELAYVTARYAALAPFGKVAVLLSELLPISGAQNAGTVRNRTLRAGMEVVQPRLVGWRSSPRRRGQRPSWSGWMAATCATGMAARSATSR